jgi:uncharacterized membrane protein YhhN
MNLNLPAMGLSLAALGSAVGAIFTAYLSRRRLAFYILKPLTTFLIFAMIAVSPPWSVNKYQGLIAVGLLFSLAGDVFLMLPPRYFEGGILCFSATHILYFLAFVSVSGIAFVQPATPLVVIIAIALAALIWRGVNPSLHIPVLAYTVLIAIMAIQAVGAAITLGTTGSIIAAAGALLFFVSDAMLAIDRFRSPFAAARALVLSSYWLGQWLIAISGKI